MTTESPLIHDGSQMVAGADWSAAFNDANGPGKSAQFLCVKASTATARTLILATAGGEAIYGILQNKPALGFAADIGILGISKARLGAVVVTGKALMTDSSARLIQATGTNQRVAVALEAGNTDQIIAVFVAPWNTVASGGG